MQRQRRMLLALICCYGCQTEVAVPLDESQSVWSLRGTDEVVATLIVAPSGSGNACSEAEPCTIEQAKAAAAALADPQGDIVIELSDGVYRLSEPLRFGPADSGKNGHRVIWRARPGAVPVLSGATQIGGFMLSDPQKNIWRAAVPPDLRTRQLYMNGARLPIAQGAAPVGLAGLKQGYEAADTT